MPVSMENMQDGNLNYITELVSQKSAVAKLLVQR